jgi:hypothetical protein
MSRELEHCSEGRVNDRCYRGFVRVVASPEAVDLVRERGGRLYVWTKSSRCCSGRLTWLEASTEPGGGRTFRRVEGAAIELYVPSDLSRLPEELVVEARGRRRHLEAYWDGCAWVV